LKYTAKTLKTNRYEIEDDGGDYCYSACELSVRMMDIARNDNHRAFKRLLKTLHNRYADACPEIYDLAPEVKI
jgi:hypothetical protein